MISGTHAVVVGYHGCDKKVGLDIINRKTKIKFSTNDYDWLGNGAYFWENNYERAKQWAEKLKRRKIINDPFVIGAVISLGNCLDLMSGDHLKILKNQFDLIKTHFKENNLALPVNSAPNSAGDVLLRPLDCLVIESLHGLNKENEIAEFTTVRGVFFEGRELYPGSSFSEMNHIQLCVRKHSSILGYFLPN